MEYITQGLPNGEEFSLEKIIKRIKLVGDERLFFIGEALRRDVSYRRNS